MIKVNGVTIGITATDIYNHILDAEIAVYVSIISYNILMNDQFLSSTTLTVKLFVFFCFKFVEMPVIV